MMFERSAGEEIHFPWWFWIIFFAIFAIGTYGQVQFEKEKAKQHEQISKSKQ